MPTSTATATGSTAAPAEPPDPLNRALPDRTGADLEDRARRLLEAIASDRPETADDFFFPLGPFVPLKDVADPARYHRQLVAAYQRDIRDLHRRHRDWTGARLVAFEPGTAPGWVKPGEEYNKIGYYRTFHAKLRYELDGRSHAVDVHTMISWGGRWWATHLGPIRR